MKRTFAQARFSPRPRTQIQGHPPVHLPREHRLHRKRGGPAREPVAERTVCARTAEQRHVLGGVHHRLRTAAEAVRGLEGRGDCPGRLFVQRCLSRIRHGSPASRLRDVDDAARPVLPRDHHGVQLHRRAGVAPEAMVIGAEPVVERCSPARWRLPDDAAAHTLDYGFSPRMFASALVQFSSTDHVFSSNLRFRWEERARQRAVRSSTPTSAATR